jgi:hypothetical protein
MYSHSGGGGLCRAERISGPLIARPLARPLSDFLKADPVDASRACAPVCRHWLGVRMKRSCRCGDSIRHRGTCRGVLGGHSAALVSDRRGRPLRIHGPPLGLRTAQKPLMHDRHSRLIPRGTAVFLVALFSWYGVEKPALRLKGRPRAIANPQPARQDRADTTGA